MDSEDIGIKPFVLSLTAIAIIEAAAQLLPAGVQTIPWIGMTLLGLVRMAEIAAVLIIVHRFCINGLSAIGLSPQTSRHGILKGLIWTAGFGAVTATLAAALYLKGINPVKMIQSPMPGSPLDILLFYIVGGVIAPVAEEICFRGVIFKYFRKWGFARAAIASTLIFVIVHPISSGIPLPQIVGGLVFAASLEIEKSLLVPIIIHGAGNMAIFTLSVI